MKDSKSFITVYLPPTFEFSYSLKKHKNSGAATTCLRVFFVRVVKPPSPSLFSCRLLVCQTLETRITYSFILKSDYKTCGLKLGIKTFLWLNLVCHKVTRHFGVESDLFYLGFLFTCQSIMYVCFFVD